MLEKITLEAAIHKYIDSIGCFYSRKLNLGTISLTLGDKINRRWGIISQGLQTLPWDFISPPCQSLAIRSYCPVSNVLIVAFLNIGIKGEFFVNIRL